MTIAVGTREFFKRLGGLFYPGYVSVFCDDDLSRFALKHGYARTANIAFQHRWAGTDRDETQRRSYRPENWHFGEGLLADREAKGFPEAGR
jgi:hypothetical protein